MYGMNPEADPLVDKEARRLERDFLRGRLGSLAMSAYPWERTRVARAAGYEAFKLFLTRLWRKRRRLWRRGRNRPYGDDLL